MKRVLLLAVAVFFPFLVGSCSRPDVKEGHVEPLETVPAKAQPVAPPSGGMEAPPTGMQEEKAPPPGGAFSSAAPAPVKKPSAQESGREAPPPAVSPQPPRPPVPVPAGPSVQAEKTGAQARASLSQPPPAPEAPQPARVPAGSVQSPPPVPPRSEALSEVRRTGGAGVIEEIVDRTVRACIAARPQGLIAVFPALSPSPATKAVRTSLLGDDISERIAGRLRKELQGVEIPTFGALRTLINQVGNRGLSDILSPEDLFVLADRIGADLVVIGTIRGVVDKRYKTLKELRFRFEAREVATARTLGVAAKTVPGNDPAVRALAERYKMTGAWRVGVYAPPFTPSLDRELNYVVLRTVSSLLVRARSALRGHRVAVAPVRTEGYQSNEVNDFLRAFNEELASLAKQVNPFLGGDPREKALDLKPVVILGKKFNSLREARDHLRVLQRRAKLSLSTRLSREMTELLYEELLRQAAGDFTVTLSLEDRRQIEDFIATENRIYDETGSIEPETIAKLKTKGAEYLVVGRFRQEGPIYVLDAYILDMRTGMRIGNRVSFALDSRLTEEINRRF